MTWPTHSAIAVSGLWMLYAALPERVEHLTGVLIVSVVIGALFPDLDATDSKLQRWTLSPSPIRPFQLLSRLIRLTSPHRGWMHSLRGLFLVSVLVGSGLITSVGFLPGYIAWIAFTGGYASHLLADRMNPSGIPLFFPQPRRWHLLPRNWRIAT